MSTFEIAVLMLIAVVLAVVARENKVLRPHLRRLFGHDDEPS